jgi:phosphate/sulfate permease
VIGSGVAGWQLACVIAAVLSFVGAICTGIAQQMRVGERLAKTLECLGRLKALDASVLAGSRADSEIAVEYENILRTYGEVLR